MQFSALILLAPLLLTGACSASNQQEENLQEQEQELQQEMQQELQQELQQEKEKELEQDGVRQPRHLLPHLLARLLGDNSDGKEFGQEFGQEQERVDVYHHHVGQVTGATPALCSSYVTETEEVEEVLYCGGQCAHVCSVQCAVCSVQSIDLVI